MPVRHFAKRYNRYMSAVAFRTGFFCLSAAALLIPFFVYGSTTAPAPRPTCKIDAQPRAIQEGQPTRLSWLTQHADDVSIAYMGPVSPSDFSIRYPSAGRADYVLAARGSGGSCTATISVSVSSSQYTTQPVTLPAAWYSPIVSAFMYVPTSLYHTVFGYEEVEVIDIVDYEEGRSYRSGGVEEITIEDTYIPYESYQPYERYQPYEPGSWREEDDDLDLGREEYGDRYYRPSVEEEYERIPDASYYGYYGGGPEYYPTYVDDSDNDGDSGE